MSVADRLKTVAWYLRDGRAATLPSLVRLKLFPHPKEDTREAATRRCVTEHVSREAALAKLAPGRRPIALAEVYGAELKAAAAACDASPVRMGGPGDMDLLYNLAEASQAASAVETGVAYGWSSLALLLSLAARDGRLISTDMPYAKAGNEPYVGVAVPDRLKPNWTLVRKPDRAALPAALAESGVIDLCHYDSDKSYAGRCFAYPRLWRALRAGGYFISDDVNDNLAFHDFAADVGAEPVIVECDGKYVGVLRKP